MTVQRGNRLHRPLFVLGSITTLVFLGGAGGSSAGIQGSGRSAIVSHGEITAFGSIFVGDVEYTISSASLTIDGKPATESQLQVGQIVTVQGVEDANGSTGTATSVDFTGDVVGPISGLSATGSSLTVLGQTVQVDDTTLFGEGIEPANLTGLQPGEGVEISAFADASGKLHASLIYLQPSGAPLQVKGTVEALDTSAQTFRINNLTVEYSGQQISGTLANGVTATVQALEAPVGNVLFASQVQVFSGIGGSVNESGQTEGLITSVTSDQVFWIGSQLIQTDFSTHFILHGQPIAPNLTVQVKGTFTASGALLASQVKAHPHQGN